MDTRYTISTYRELCSNLNPENEETKEALDSFIEGCMRNRFNDEEAGYAANAIASDLYDTGMNMIESGAHKTEEFAKLVYTLLIGQFFGDAYTVTEFAAAVEDER